MGRWMGEWIGKRVNVKREGGEIGKLMDLWVGNCMKGRMGGSTG